MMERGQESAYECISCGLEDKKRFSHNSNICLFPNTILIDAATLVRKGVSSSPTECFTIVTLCETKLILVSIIWKAGVSFFPFYLFVSNLNKKSMFWVLFVIIYQ